MIFSKLILADAVNALKGFAMGAANVIPGVSGGTIALITGIFGRIVASLNSIVSVSNWKLLLKGRVGEFLSKTDGRFLLAVCVGMALSVLSLAKVMTYVLDRYPVQTWAFFFGMIAASAIYMLTGIKGWKLSYAVWIFLGVALGVFLFTVSPAQTTDDLWFIFVCGAIAICTMILPGVSGSFVLLLLGKYEYIMEAIGRLDWPVLAVFGAGCVAGLAAFSMVLHWLLGRWENQTMLVLIGFVMGSLVKVWPWSAESMDKAALAAGGVPAGSMILPGIVWMIAGIAAVAAMEFAGRASREA